MTPRRVGILGGMGPQATVLLMQKVIAAVDAGDDSDHVPLIVDQNPQVPSRIARLIEGGGEDPAPVLADMARRLEAAGATALAMPCNTAHHYAAEIRSAVEIPFLDVIGAAASHARALAGAGGTVGVLASPAVRRIGIYEAAFEAAGLSAPLYPSDEEALLSTIRRIKARGDDDTARAALGTLSHWLAERGAEVQVIACTEFSLIADSTAPGARSFDALDRLVAEIVAFAFGFDPRATEGA